MVAIGLKEDELHSRGMGARSVTVLGLRVIPLLYRDYSNQITTKMIKIADVALGLKRCLGDQLEAVAVGLVEAL